MSRSFLKATTGLARSSISSTRNGLLAAPYLLRYTCNGNFNSIEKIIKLRYKKKSQVQNRACLTFYCKPSRAFRKLRHEQIHSKLLSLYVCTGQ